MDISNGNIKTNNTDGFSIERCFIEDHFNPEQNTKVIDCVFTKGISAYSGTDSLNIENTEILAGGLKYIYHIVQIQKKQKYMF